MGFALIIKNIINRIVSFVEGIVYRMEKKGNNVRGYAFGGPRRAMKVALGFIALILASVVAAVLIKDGSLVSVERMLEREVATGVKKPTSLRPNLEGRDIGRFAGGPGPAERSVDCNAIIRSLKVRGALTLQQKADFDQFCRKKLGESMAKLVDLITQKSLPRDVVKTLLEQTPPERADEAVEALSDPDIVEALRTDSGDVVAKRLVDLAKLDKDDLKKVLAAVRQAPPKFKQGVMDAGIKIASGLNPEAKDALLDELVKSRSAQEINNIRDFTELLADADEKEQKILTDSFLRAKTPSNRRALVEAVREIVQIDPSDPVRKKLVDTIEQVSRLPEDQQKKFYKKFGDLARIYRKTEDPKLKAIMSKAIGDSLSLGGLEGIADRVKDVYDISKAGELDLEVAKRAIEGTDETAIARVKAAAIAARRGATKDLKRLMNPETSLNELREYIANNARAGRGDEANVTVGDLKNKISERNELGSEIAAIQSQIDALLGAGVSPSDARVVSLYKRLLDKQQRLASLTKQIREAQAHLHEKMRGIKRRLGSELKSAGFVMPDFDIKLPEGTGTSSAPAGRLSRLAQLEEFWGGGLDDKSREFIRRKKQTGLSFRPGEQAEGSILDDITEDKGEQWYSVAYGAGGQGGLTVSREFEMSRLMHIPGIIRRIPEQGISSSGVGRLVLEFEFLADVANRKTGKIEIPRGSVAICKPSSFDNSTGRLDANCDTVDTGAAKDISVNLILGDPKGVDGLTGRIVDNRGWYLAGVFLTAFSQAIIEGFANTTLSSVEARAEKTAADYVIIGAGGGTQGILQEVASKQIEDWQSADTFWHGFSGMPATVRQK